jgi:hypothetical protein
MSSTSINKEHTTIWIFLSGILNTFEPYQIDALGTKSEADRMARANTFAHSVLELTFHAPQHKL